MEKRDDDCIDIPVKIPKSFVARFAGHIITVCIMGALTAFQAWFMHTVVTTHQQHTTTAISNSNTAKESELAEMREQIHDLKQLYADCRRDYEKQNHDFEELKRILGIKITENGDVTVRKFFNRGE